MFLITSAILRNVGNGTEQTTPGVGPRTGNNKGRPNLFMAETVYHNLTPKQRQSLDNYCSGLEFDRWNRDKEIPKSAHNSKFIFVEKMRMDGRQSWNNGSFSGNIHE